MEPSASRGNSPEKWGKLLDELDQKLQLGLLDRLRRVISYHFEDQTVFIEAGSAEDLAYLEKSAVMQQLNVFVSVCGASKVILQKNTSL